MCIALLSTAHPDYSLILLSNRDEFLARPTAPADWWQAPNTHVLGGRDLQRSEQGTWLGITKDGRIAILTNFRDEGREVTKDKSRGGIVTAYLGTPPGKGEAEDEAFSNKLIGTPGISDVGGFSLCFGHVQALARPKNPGLSIVSNRTSSAEGLVHILRSRGQTRGLSNSYFGDTSWPKVVHGEELLRNAIKEGTERQASKDELLESFFDVLSVSTLPARQAHEDWNTYTRQLRNSIFIPPFGGEVTNDKSSDELAAARPDSAYKAEDIKPMGGVYGTQKQTVVLVGKDGNVTFVERTLYDGEGKPLGKEQRHRKFQFQIDASAKS
nr:hypothetical protein B0A51_05166 [Rachicladosporium sp. CCFEE 5018]